MDVGTLNSAPDAAALSPAELLAHIDALQRELATLNQEVNLLRRRDETLHFYMTRLDEELRLAARIQQDFLPRTLPQVGRVHFHALFRPAGYVSGDLYDVSRLDETHIGFYMADAVGHGMPAALLTMFLKRALVNKEITAGGYRLLTPSESMSRLNDALVEQQLSQCAFATAICGIVDTTSLEVSFARGGHPNPLLLRRDGTMRPLEVAGSLLGVFGGDQYPQHTIQLESGDRLFVFTDGIEVAFCEDHEQGAQQWQRELQTRGGMKTEQLLCDFARRLDGECGSLQPKDDLTVLVIEVE